MEPDSDKAAPSAKERKFGSPLLNIGLLAIGAAWLAVLAAEGQGKVERWLAAGLLCVVGITGFFRIGTKKAAPGDAGSDTEGS